MLIECTGYDRPALFRLNHDDAAASNRDVRDDSKSTALPVAREIVETYVAAPFKAPWSIDLLNINLNNEDLVEATQRIGQLHGCIRPGLHPHHTEPGFRGREKRRSVGAGRSQS
jgi:hypothetical protein